MSENDVGVVEPGWSVKSSDQQSVGSIQEVTETYFRVKGGLVGGEERYLPLATLEHVRADKKEIELDLSASELEAGDWSEPPQQPPRTEGAPLNAQTDAEVDRTMSQSVPDDPRRSADFDTKRV